MPSRMRRPLCAFAIATCLWAACSQPPAATPSSAPTTAAPASATAAPTTAASASAPRTVTLGDVVNTVEVRPSPDTAFTPAAAGSGLAVGSQIKTGDASIARLDFSEGSILRLTPNSTLTLQDLTTADGSPLTHLKLDFGKLWINLAGGGLLQVDTFVAVTYVQGSFASIQYDLANDVLTVNCLEGLCAVRNDTVNETLGNLTQIVLRNGGKKVTRAPLPGQAVLDYLQSNPDGGAIVAALTAAPPGTPTRMLIFPTAPGTATPTTTGTPALTGTPTATPAATGTATPMSTVTVTPTPILTNTPSLPIFKLPTATPTNTPSLPIFKLPTATPTSTPSLRLPLLSN